MMFGTDGSVGAGRAGFDIGMILSFELLFTLAAGVVASTVGNGEVMKEITELVASLGENWRGVVILLAVVGALAGGPPIYVLRRIMDLQEREGQANRDVQREVAAANRETQRAISESTSQAIGKLGDAVRQLELAIARSIRG